MSITIQIKLTGRDQPALIEALDQARKNLIDGCCHLHSVGVCDMKPADEDSETEFRRQYADAHPRPAARWTSK